MTAEPETEKLGGVSFTVYATPATFATAGEKPWRLAVDAAARRAMGGSPPLAGRLLVDLLFVMPRRTATHPGWDLDNLIKPTIDALGPVIGMRPGNWPSPQVDDERIIEIRARKRELDKGETPLGVIEVRSLESSSARGQART